MKSRRFPSMPLVVLIGASALIWQAETVWACSVCFGDPESPMAKGVVAGVLVLVGVIGMVLLGVVGTGLSWVSRSRALARLEDTDPAHDP